MSEYTLQFHAYASSNDLDALERLYSQHADHINPNYAVPDHLEFTALMQATWRNNAQIVWWMLDHIQRININKRNKQRQTAFMLAARCMAQNVMQVLLHTGKVAMNDVDVDGNTALALAGHFGFVEIVQILLEVGVDTAIVNAAGNTADQVAEKNHKEECARWIRNYDHKVKDALGVWYRIQGKEKDIALKYWSALHQGGEHRVKLDKQQAIDFLMRTRLDEVRLKQIWNLACERDHKTFLTLPTFLMALRLACVAQQSPGAHLDKSMGLDTKKALIPVIYDSVQTSNVGSSSIQHPTSIYLADPKPVAGFDETQSSSDEEHEDLADQEAARFDIKADSMTRKSREF